MMLSLLWLAAALVPRPGCVPVAEDRILAKHLAAASPIFEALAPDLVIGYAPVPGLERTFTAEELERIALKNNLSGRIEKGVCFERLLAEIKPEEVLEAVRKSLNNPQARIEIIEIGRPPVPPGTLVFPLSGLAPPTSPTAPVRWRGYMQSADGQKYSLWASVKIGVPGTRVVARELLRAGAPIQAGQLRLEQYEGFPAGPFWYGSIEQVAGKVARRTILAETPLSPTLVDAPREIERGDPVKVELRTGRVVLQVDGVAQSGGARGDMIQVRNTVSGKTLAARVEGKSRVSVLTFPSQ